MTNAQRVAREINRIAIVPTSVCHYCYFLYPGEKPRRQQWFPLFPSFLSKTCRNLSCRIQSTDINSYRNANRNCRPLILSQIACPSVNDAQGTLLVYKIRDGGPHARVNIRAVNQTPLCVACVSIRYAKRKDLISIRKKIGRSVDVCSRGHVAQESFFETRAVMLYNALKGIPCAQDQTGVKGRIFSGHKSRNRVRNASGEKRIKICHHGMTAARTHSKNFSIKFIYTLYPHAQQKFQNQIYWRTLTRIVTPHTSKSSFLYASTSKI